MSPIVFLGPSLPLTDARQILSADYRSPVRAGDLDALLNSRTVLILDGILEPGIRLPVREACRALGNGICLYGAASTGALLAAELITSGVIGLGKIFSYLTHHPDNREDLLAVLHYEHDTRPLTVPLINPVLWLEAARPILGTATDQAIYELLQIPLSERSPENIRANLSPFSSILRGYPVIPNIKRADAILSLLHLATLTK